MQSLASRASDPRARRIERGRPAFSAAGGGAEGKPAMRFGGAPRISDPPGAPSRSQSARFTFTDDDLVHVLRAAELSHGSDGLVQPHPRSGCVLLDSAGAVVARTFQMGQGGVRSEVLAAREAGARADGGVAYLNLEPAHGPAVGEDAAVDALVRSRVSRVVVGILHPVAGVRAKPSRRSATRASAWTSSGSSPPGSRPPRTNAPPPPSPRASRGAATPTAISCARVATSEAVQRLQVRHDRRRGRSP